MVTPLELDSFPGDAGGENLHCLLEICVRLEIVGRISMYMFDILCIIKRWTSCGVMSVYCQLNYLQPKEMECVHEGKDVL